jgi:DNA-binding transcriptional LysR family regulator
MNLSALDLNLLVALDAFLKDASVSRAALRIGLSQPAASHALRRLRETMQDPLLVRVGARMELTPRAESLKAPLADALERVRSLFGAPEFDPASSTRRFSLLMPDLVSELILPPLLKRMGADAPETGLDVRPWRGPASMSPEFARSIDLVLSCTGDAYPGFYRQRLYTDKDVLAVRHGHPQAAKLRTPDGFQRARHIAVIGAGQREDLIDSWLRQEGLEREIALAVPSYLQALRIASQTDLVAFVPRRLAESLAEPFAIMTVPPPLDPGSDVQFLFYPARAKADPGSVWLRRMVSDIGRALDGRGRQKTPSNLAHSD